METDRDIYEFYGANEADDEEYQLRREEMREEMEYYKQAQEDEAESYAFRLSLAEECPVCGKDCGVPDPYEPPENSVGIMSGFFHNVCPEHGGWFVWDDESIEMEDAQ